MLNTVCPQDGASKYKLEQFYTDREEVERGLHSEVALRLGGNKQCCSKKCNGEPSLLSYTRDIVPSQTDSSCSVTSYSASLGVSCNVQPRL